MTEQTPQQRSAELRRKIEAALAVASAARYNKRPGSGGTLRAGGHR